MSYIIGKKLYLPLQKVPSSVFEAALDFAVKEMDTQINESKNKVKALEGEFKPVVLDIQNIEGYYKNDSIKSFNQLVKSKNLEKYLFSNLTEDLIFKACNNALKKSKYAAVVEDFGVNVNLNLFSVESLIPEYDVDSVNSEFLLRVKAYIEIGIYN